MKSDKRFGVRGAIFAACLVGSLAFACGGGDENNSGGGDSNASGDSGGGTPAMTAMPAGVGVVKGKVMAAKYKKPSKLPAVTTDKVCSDHFPDGSYVPEKNKMNEDKTLPNVFVYVSKVDGVAPEKKWKFAVPSDTVTIIQEGCQYLPHVVGVMKGQKLSVASKDATQHNVHWMGRKNKFYKNNWIQTKGMEHTDTLKKAENAMFKCDVHGWMSCQVHVMNHPLFTVTDDKGNYTLPKLPAGEYEITAMHERYHTTKQKVTVKDGDVTLDIHYKK